jgi:hypothetical protein
MGLRNTSSKSTLRGSTVKSCSRALHRPVELARAIGQVSITGQERRPGELWPSLEREAFGDEYAALRGALPDRLDRHVGWRVLPSMSFLHAVERDYRDPLGRFAFHRLDLDGAKEIVGVERRQRFRDLLRIFLKGGGVRDIDFRDNVAWWRLDLLRVNRRGSSNADRDASQNRQCQFVVRLHGLIPLIASCEQAVAVEQDGRRQNRTHL